MTKFSYGVDFRICRGLGGIAREASEGKAVKKGLSIFYFRLSVFGADVWKKGREVRVTGAGSRVRWFYRKVAGPPNGVRRLGRRRPAGALPPYTRVFRGIFFACHI
jgi:hypothetical protein